MTVCAECGGEQRYVCYHEAGKMVYWFCEPDHKDTWLRRRKRQSRRHGASNGRKVQLIGATLLSLFLFLFPARAEWDGEEGKMSEWFQSLFDQNGRSCCGSGDYHRVNYRGKDDGTQIEWKGKWYDVPDVAKVKNFANPTGEGAAFFYEDAQGAPREIFCFIRAVEG